MSAFDRVFRTAGALLAGALVVSGGCASHHARERSPTATLLSEKLARVRAASSPADGAGEEAARKDAAPDAMNRAGALAAAPRHPRPRPLDPVPPLYSPPPRALPLQPVLVGRHAVPLDSLPRPFPSRRDPLADDPLRRIDPLTGLDPLGRPDPSGGVDLGTGRP